MLQVDAGIIGGTGLGELLLAMPGSSIHLPTPKGFVRGRLVQVGSKSVFAASRHSSGHKTPPHRVNYAVMAIAMKQLGVKACFASAAVGSLRPDWAPGTLVACQDFIDDSNRRVTLFDRTVNHTDFSQPFPLASLVAKAASSLNLQTKDGIYVCGNGPRYETPEEVRLYRSWGGDVVGMTAATEAVVMREAAVPYACLAIVTNLGTGLSRENLDHADVANAMKKSGELALRIILKAIECL